MAGTVFYTNLAQIWYSRSVAPLMIVCAVSVFNETARKRQFWYDRVTCVQEFFFNAWIGKHRLEFRIGSFCGVRGLAYCLAYLSEIRCFGQCSISGTLSNSDSGLSVQMMA